MSEYLTYDEMTDDQRTWNGRKNLNAVRRPATFRVELRQPRNGEKYFDGGSIETAYRDNYTDCPVAVIVAEL